MAIMDNLPSIRRGGISRLNPDKIDFESRGDKVLHEKIKAIKASRDQLGRLDGLVRDALELPDNQTHSLVARAMHKVIPQRFHGILPASLMKFVAEEYDVLEFIETLMRSNVDDVQEALRALAYCAFGKREEHDELAEYLKKARKEELGAQELQDYIAERAGVEICEEVAHLLDQEFKVLSEEQKEERKKELLDQLEANVAIGEEFMEFMGQICVAGLREFHKGVSQYFNYLNVYRPLIVVRDSAKTLTEMNHSMFVAKDAVKAIFTASVQAMEFAVDAADMIDVYSLAAADMRGMFKSGKERLEAKLQKLQSSNGKVLALESRKKVGS